MYEEDYSITLLKLEETLYLVEETLATKERSEYGSENESDIYMQIQSFEDILGDQFSFTFTQTNCLLVAVLLSLRNLCESLFQDIPHPSLQQLNKILLLLTSFDKTSIDSKTEFSISNNDLAQIIKLLPESGNTFSKATNKPIISALRYSRTLVVQAYEDFQRANMPTHN